MKQRLFYILTLLIVLSCNKEDSDIKQADGEVWNSGGLYYCAQQIRLDNGDTLVISKDDIITITGRVNIKYREKGINENCSPYIDCEIIKIKKID